MGRNAEQRLREGGIDASRVSGSQTVMVPVTALWAAPEGHACFDPRSLHPTDDAMAADMVERVRQGLPPNTRPVEAREEPQDGDEIRLLIVDGHTRGNALRLAEKTLRKAGILAKDEPLRCRVDLWHGSNTELIEYRLRANDHDRYQHRDTASVMAFRVRQLLGLGRKPSQIAAACPKGIGPAEVEALYRFEDLEPAERAPFDDGTAPIGLLAAVLAAPRGKRLARLSELQANGVRTAKGATRHTNGEKAKADPWARRMSPRQMIHVAARVSACSAVEQDFKVLKRAADRDDAGLQIMRSSIKIALLIAANRDATAMLAHLPKPIADAIRAAHAGKAGAK